MTKLTENAIEQLIVELLQTLNYQYLHGSALTPNPSSTGQGAGSEGEREKYHDVVLKPRLLKALTKLNPELPQTAINQAIQTLLNINTPDLINNNQTFHQYLTEGVTIEYQKNGITRSEPVKLIDFNHPENNEYLVVNQFTIIENNHERRPDLIIFINGLPLIVIELKNPTKEQTDIKKAYQQLQTYKQDIPSLFTYNSLLVISDGIETRYGSLSADFNRFMTWKMPLLLDPHPQGDLPLLPSPTGRGAGESKNPLENLILGLLNQATLLDLIRHFTIFETTKTENPKTRVTTVKTIKKITAYHQYYAVNKAVNSIIQASSATGNRRGGVIWHTQGSGKSLSMVFLAGKLVLLLNNPTIVILTDRNDLDDQLFDTFANCRQLLRQDPQQAENREAIKQLLNVASGGIIFTTVQKFAPTDGETLYPQLSARTNIIVLADEAHRSQYGFRAKQVNIKDETGEIIGKKTGYGFAKYIRDALPNATFVGFTGTPVEATDKNTPAVFGDYLDIYDIAKAVEDQATVPIYYESRLVKVELDIKGRKLLAELDEELEELAPETLAKTKAKRTRLASIIGSTQRLQQIAPDIINHFETRQQIFQGKGIIVTFSREIAVKLYHEMIKNRPQWHSENLDEGQIKVIMTASADDGAKMAKHHTTKRERRILSDRLKNPADPLNLVIVCDMWLTGFDAPCLHTMYIDKPMKGHNLMQAIARVNRVYLDKPGGLIVDYLGVANELREALSFYAESGGNGQPTLDQEEAINLMLTKLEIVQNLLYGCNYQQYFKADTREKLDIILDTKEFILKLENGKTRFYREVTALAKAFTLAIPSDEAMRKAEEISFYQAVKAGLEKFERYNDVSDDDIETTIKQVIDQALVSDRVINIFDATGIKKPDISILSDQFLAEIKDLKRKNLSVELLKRLLNDEIKIRQQTNLTQSRKLAELLENTLRKYQNRVVDTADVIEELINLAKDIRNTKEQGENLGLTDYEIAFYDALANNDSAREVMGKEKLKELAIVLAQNIRENASIDWNIKDNVRAKMRNTVKRLLNKYGYPPDMQKLAVDLVLEQAELFTANIVGK